MKQQKQRLLALQGVRVLSKEQSKVIAGGGNFSVLSVSCECVDGSSYGLPDCSKCDTYCNSHNGQSTTSDCCKGSS